MPADAASGELLSVVVPAHNEAATIASVIEDLKAALANLSGPWEIIVVDDGSSDGTGARAGAFGERVRVLRNPVNLGYGHSILRGIALAKGGLIAIVDADGTYPVSQIPELYARILDGVDHVIGQRTGENIRRPWFRRNVYRWLCGYVVGMRVPDANSGLRVFRREVVEALRVDLCLGFSFTTSLTLASLMTGHVVAFSPIPYRKRSGRSHVRFRDTLRTAQYLFQLIAVYNPIKIFLPLILTTAALAAAGLGLAVGNGSPAGRLTAIVMSAATVLLVGLAAHAYIVSRAGHPPVSAGAHLRRRESTGPRAEAPSGKRG